MQYKLKWRATLKDQGLSLLAFIKEKTQSQLSNRSLKKVIEKGVCKLNHKTETFASIKIKENDLIELCDLLNNIDKKPHLKILFEDSYFLIIDKEVGIVCSEEETKSYFPHTFLLHRLDKETSGVLMLTKSLKVKDEMIKLFKKKMVKKTYIAVIDGKIKEDRKEFKSNVELKPSFGKVMWHSTKKGAFAHTIFEKIKVSSNFSVVRAFPITGKTHQIRIHLSEWGHPILGDYKYAQKFLYPNFVPRLLLHSFKVDFIHPITHNNIQVIAPIPREFKPFVSKDEIFNH